MKLLRELRIEYGKTQEKMAAVLGTSRQVYANYENGINEPPFDILIKLADFFDCTTDYLLGREDDFGVIHSTRPADELTQEEKRLLKVFRKLNTKNRMHALAYAEVRLEEQQSARA